MPSPSALRNSGDVPLRRLIRTRGMFVPPRSFDVKRREAIHDVSKRSWNFVLRCARREENAGIKWRDAEEDLLGYVHRAGTDRGHGASAVVGAGGHDSNWGCELGVCVSTGRGFLGGEFRNRFQRETAFKIVLCAMPQTGD